jgi:colanic acid/amylovoran biosynthesis glycosyltransferase
MGKAVVSTRHAGIPDVISHEQNGLLADEYSNTQLKENIKRLLTDSELRHALGEKAGCHIKKLYSVETMTYTLGQIFSGIVTSAGK